MATEVRMPALGMAQETGRVLRWLKAEGAAVTQGEALIEIETDKTTVELEAPVGGILMGVSAAPGDDVPVGERIALILAPGEELPSSQPPEQTARAPLPAHAAGAQTARAPLAGQSAGAQTPPAPMPGPAGARPRASPKARRLAREHGIDVAALTGSGPGGVALGADVLAAASREEAGSMIPASGVWRLMAERTTRSWTTAPHFFLIRDVQAAPLEEWRAALDTDPAASVTYSDLLVSLVASALRDHPRLNARWEPQGIMILPEINIGVAVAAEAGLVVPVIHQADRLDVHEIAARRRDLVDRARAGRLRPGELQGGTFTISNLGMFGVDAFTAVINPPQAAILAVGRISRRVVAVDDHPAVRPMMTLVLSCDHRAVDGAIGARFLNTLARLIEDLHSTTSR